MSSKPLPSEVCGALLSEDLLRILDTLFPDRCPNPQDTEREIWMKAGERRAVDKMRSWFDSAESLTLSVLDQNTHVSHP